MDTPHLGLTHEPQGACSSLGIVDHTLDDANLESRCPLDKGRRRPDTTRSAGLLDSLPLELVSAILLALDLQSLMVLRQVSSRTMSLVDGLHQYTMVRQHCPNVLRAIISIAATSFSCKTLYKTLCASKCASCDRFGSYVYLVRCERVCYLCFTQRDAYLPLTVSEATKGKLMSRKELQFLPHVLSLPGRYTASGQLSRKRILLFDRLSVSKVLQEASGVVRDGDIQQRRDRRTREPRRYMAIISAPYLDQFKQSADWGLYCLGCRDRTNSTDAEAHFRNQFTRDGMAKHIALHGEMTFDKRRKRMVHSQSLREASEQTYNIDT
ncbi:hypothetical protein HJFPF1_07136 [Paramyrothecium foliicola]|nr:hypothetical protein HJFPF1_07136 [Paramyrothecium foliicola]